MWIVIASYRLFFDEQSKNYRTNDAINIYLYENQKYYTNLFIDLMTMVLGLWPKYISRHNASVCVT